MLSYKSIKELAERAAESDKNISEVVMADQALQLGHSSDELYADMNIMFKAMAESVSEGMKANMKSPSGLSGGNSAKLAQALKSGSSVGGGIFTGTLVKAIAVAEYNACMGRIVAAPTAGSCGIMPAVLITQMEEKGIPEKDVVMSLFTAAAVGMVVAGRASVSGAEGGCQAECGSASAMAAAALVEILGGTPKQVEHACAIALKNILGLVCDPVAGLVEVPCIKRNAMGAANALTAAELALADIESVIPADEVIDAMRQVGKLMPDELRETAGGGLAGTPTGKKLAEMLLRQS